MESKKRVRVKLYSDRRHYSVIEVNEDEVEKIREINRMTWREQELEIRRRKQLEKEEISVCSLESLDADGDNIADGKQTAEGQVIEEESIRERNAELHRAIKLLTPRQQEMVNMIFFEELSQDEIAKRYRVTKSAISHAMERIYATLKKYLEKN